MSLREEIKDIIWNGNSYNAGELADKILSAVEKRIDSVNDLPDSIKNGDYHGDEEFWAGYGLGFDRAIELTKEKVK